MSEARSSARWLLLAVVGIGVFLITLDNTVLYTALPTLVGELNATSTQQLWVVNAYPVVIAGLLLGTGTLGDKIGHRLMFTVGLCIFGIASVIAAFSPAPEFLIGARVLLAIGAATMMPSTLSLIRLTFTKSRELSFAIGVWALLSVVASALGPLVGGLLLEWFWWGSVFLINIPMVIFALITLPFVAPRSVRNPDKHWDVISSLMAMVCLVGAVMTIKELAHSAQNWPLIAVAMVCAVVGGFLFVRRQPRLEQPLLTLEVFKEPAFVAGAIGASFAMFGTVGLQYIVSQKTQLIDGFSPLQAGLVVSAIAVGSALTSVIAGARLHILGARRLVAGGLGIAAIGSLVVGLGGVVHSNIVLAFGLFIMGTGLGAVMSVASILMISNAPPHRAGMAASVEEVSYEFGSLSAVALLGSLITFIFSASYVVPEGAPARAGEGMQDARLAVAESHLPHELAEEVLARAHESFNAGFIACTVLVTAVFAVGALITSRNLRGYVLSEEETH